MMKNMIELEKFGLEMVLLITLLVDKKHILCDKGGFLKYNIILDVMSCFGEKKFFQEPVNLITHESSVSKPCHKDPVSTREHRKLKYRIMLPNDRSAKKP